MPMTMTDLLLRIRALLFHARAERDLDDEVEFHLAMAERKHAAAGHPAKEAARLAQRDFGRIGGVKEDCRTVRGIQALETAVQDVRYAVRGFRRNPGFVLTVAGTIAVGLGVNVALFTLFNVYVLRPVAVRDPYSLYSFTWTDASGRGHAFSWDEYRDFEREHPAFSEVAAEDYVYTRMNGRVFEGQLVTGNYFEMLGVGPVVGRTLRREDAAAPGSDPVIVLSYEAWQKTFEGRPDIVGTKVMIRGYPMEVIGVAKPGFTGLADVPRDFWAPVTMASRLQDGPGLFGPEHPGRLQVVGRLQDGERIARAEAMLAAWAKRMTLQQPEDRRARGILLQSKATAIPMTPELLLAFSPLVAAFALVLVLACTNVASMMLARAIARQREIGIRLSLGAVRRRLIQQLLTESILLSIPAAILGLVVSRLTIKGAVWVMFATVPNDLLELIHNVALPVDWRVIVFMIAAAVASSLLFGAAPAVQATRANVMAAARGEFTSDIKPVRFRNGLVIAQVTVCTLLLVACGALLRTTLRMSAFDLGFRTGGVIAMNIVEAGRGRVIAALASDAGVEEIAAASSVPLGGLVPSMNATAQNGQTISAAYNYVSPEYFGMLHIPVLRGRNFTREEGMAEAPVAMISVATAERLFRGENALGQLVHVAGKPARDVRIVGVVPDIVTCCIVYGKDAALVYLPAAASARGAMLVRVRGNVEAERRRLDTRLGALAPGAVADIHSLDQYRAAAIYPFRAASMIGMAVGGLALLLTISGIYGVVSFLVTQSANPGCRDEYRLQGEAGKKLGYPVEYAMKSSENGGAPVVLEMKVTALSTANLDASLFEPPAGYTEAGAAAVQAPPPGAAKIGVAALRNRSGAAVDTAALDGQVASQFAGSKFLTVPVAGNSDAELLADARQKECQYVLTTDVAEVKRPAIGRIGGLLGRATGGDSKGVVDARVDYRLVSVASGQPVAASSAAGRSGSVLTLRAAVSIATMATTFGMSRFMMNPTMMRAMMNPSASAADPAMSGLFFAQSHTSMMANPMAAPPAPQTAEGAAITSAIGNAVKALLTQVP